jgi:hypothetical protein
MSAKHADLHARLRPASSAERDGGVLAPLRPAKVVESTVAEVLRATGGGQEAGARWAGDDLADVRQAAPEVAEP